MSASIIDNIGQIVGFAILFFAPFSKQRVRAGWAKTVCILGSVIGIGRGVIGLSWDLRWLSLNSRDTRLYDSVGGILLGILFCLIFSGQLCGKKQPDITALEPTATAP